MAVSEKSRSNLKPFQKNDGDKKDKRINRKGRITNFSQARKLALDVANEIISEEDGLSRLKALFRVMSSSRNPADRMGFLAYAVGKPKEEVDITSQGKAVKGYTVLANPDMWDEEADGG